MNPSTVNAHMNVDLLYFVQDWRSNREVLGMQASSRLTDSGTLRNSSRLEEKVETIYQCLYRGFYDVGGNAHGSPTVVLVGELYGHSNHALRILHLSGQDDLVVDKRYL